MTKIPKSTKQTLIFFKDFIRRKKVVEFIKEYRQEFNLPEKGLEYTDEDKEEIINNKPLLFYTPEKIKGKVSPGRRGESLKKINNFLHQQDINSVTVSTLLRFYAFYNEIIEEILQEHTRQNDLLKLETMEEILDPFLEDPYLAQEFYKVMKKRGKDYPLILFINPETSQRKIIDFIQNNWDFIERIKKRTEKKFSRFREKDDKKQERNDFIYEHRSLPLKKIRKLVLKRFPLEFLDEGEIGKIISLEKKRREK